MIFCSSDWNEDYCEESGFLKNGHNLVLCMDMSRHKIGFGCSLAQ